MPDEQITHPGGWEISDEYDTGWRTAITHCWRKIEFAKTAKECRDIIAELGNKSPTRELAKRNG